MRHLSVLIIDTSCFLIKLGLGIFLLVTVMTVGLGCRNMKGCIFDKWCWSAGTGSCTLASELLYVCWVSR